MESSKDNFFAVSDSSCGLVFVVSGLVIIVSTEATGLFAGRSCWLEAQAYTRAAKTSIDKYFMKKPLI